MQGTAVSGRSLHLIVTLKCCQTACQKKSQYKKTENSLQKYRLRAKK